MVVPVVLQIAVPLALLMWQVFGRDTNIVAWVLKHAAVWTYIYATSLAGLWLAVPWYLPDVLMVVSIAIAGWTLPGALGLGHAPTARAQWLGLAVRVAVAAASVSTSWMAVHGRMPPSAPAVDLTFPLRAGTYYIANGGSTRLVNAHVRMMADERFRRHRGSSYGIDIVGLNLLGTHANGIAPRDAVEYAIFGDAIYPPCEGVVIRAEDGLPDLSPPDVDRAHAPGNFVMLECGDDEVFHVLLGHMQRDSVRVHPGDYVTTGMQLGNVGNSGNSDEPHLHVHAQRPGWIWNLFSADPLAIRFDGRFLVRNDRLTVVSVDDIIDD